MRGHQFGHWVPQLGDGRAVLLGEVTDRDGARRDIQLKGAGRTPFSRRGDGRAVLGPVLREYIVGEAMAALGIATTRALAVVATGERILRDGPQPGAVLTRVARSHVRIGTFEFFANRGDGDAVRRLADYVIARLYPESAAAARPYGALLEAVIGRTAALIARWQLVGFIHGVMNTDNMSIAGETIDYGPCAFMDVYHPATVYSSIDVGGRYAYGNQPRIAQWNLARLAQALLPLLDDDEAAALAAAARRGAAGRRGAPGDDACGEPRLHPAQPPGGGGAGGRRSGRPGPARLPAGRAGGGLSGPAGMGRLRRSAAARRGGARDFLRHLTAGRRRSGRKTRPEAGRCRPPRPRKWLARRPRSMD